MQDAYKPRNPRRGRIRVRLFSLVALGRIVLDENGQIVSLSGRTTDVCSKIGSSPL